MKTPLNTNPRKSNIELLRILAIVMIIAHHVAVHSGFSFGSDTISLNRFWIQLIQLGGKIGVNIFVLISGYFLVTAKTIKLNKLMKLWLQLFTYSAAIFGIMVIVSPQNFGIKALIKSVLPVTFSGWWFASAYFVLYLLSPYINKLLTSFTKKEDQRFLLLLLVLWCIIPTFTNRVWESNELLWFVFLYALAGYLRLYVDISAVKSGRWLLPAFVVMLLTFLSAVVFDVLGTKISLFASHATFFYDMQKLPVLAAAVMLFVGFSNARIGYVPFINIVSSACFGVYLIHDNNYIRPLLWHTLFKNAAYQDSRYLIPYTLLEIVLVFVACTILELLRIYLVERLYSGPIEKLSGWITAKAESLLAKVDKD